MIEYVIPSPIQHDYGKVNSFLSDENGIWAATARGVIWLPLDKNANELGAAFQGRLEPNIAEYVAYVIYRDTTTKELYMGTNRGTAYFSKKSRKMLPRVKKLSLFLRDCPEKVVTAIGREEKKEVYWFGTKDGLVKWIRDENRCEPVSRFKSQSIKLIYEDTDENTLWVGTEDGLFKWRPRTNYFDREPPRNIVLALRAKKKGVPIQWDGKILGRFSLKQVQDVYRDPTERAYWLATNEGIFKAIDGQSDPHSVRISLAEARHGTAQFSDRAVVDLALDGGGRLWMSTAVGDKHQIWFAYRKRTSASVDEHLEWISRKSPFDYFLRRLQTGLDSTLEGIQR